VVAPIEGRAYAADDFPRVAELLLAAREANRWLWAAVGLT
jgi:hypothetical protein